MATITPSIEPSSFLDHQAINFSFSQDVVEVAVTEGNIPPTLSKYIAYDTLNPPTPFLAVTEDGRGRVFYTGGFPKFYNRTWNNATVFSALAADHKFFHNALSWLQNSKKTTKDILVICDTEIEGGIYSVTGESYAGFGIVINGVCAISGHRPTYRELSSFASGKIDLSLSYLDQFSMVVVFSSANRHVGMFSEATINDMVTYRENGNGIFLITDHGYTLTSTDDANNNEIAYFKTANQIATRFGAYFSGWYNRPAVNVGYLRRTYGDHPLYAGIGDSEEIGLGDSDSAIIVTTSPTFPPAQMPTMYTRNSGINYINVLALVSDGSVVTGRYTYIVAGDEILFVRDSDGQTEYTNSYVIARIDGSLQFALETSGASLGTLWGEILLNGKRIGTFNEANGVTGMFIFAGTNIRAKPGDTLVIKLVNPFSYQKSLGIKTITPDIRSKVSLSAVNKALKPSYGGFQGSTLKRAHSAYNDYAEYNKSAAVTHRARASLFKDVYKKIHGATRAFSCAMVDTNAAGISIVANSGFQLVRHAFNYNTGELITWSEGEVKVVVGTLAKDILAPGQIVISNADPGTWRLNAAGNFVKIA